MKERMPKTDNHCWQVLEEEGRKSQQMWLWKLRTLGKVGVNEVSTGTQRQKNGIGWPEEFQARKEIWEDKNMRKIAGTI